MSTTPAPAAGAGAAPAARLDQLIDQLGGLLGRRLGPAGRHADLFMAMGVIAILVVLILPLPSWLLDVSLAFSITLSVMILLTALFVERPLEFNAFPTVLLLSTMVRLALNLASTRLILNHGHEGTQAAGHVIEAFARLVMGGNFVIGIIVFAILMIVNFIVITKGSGRIAEVSARFTLDAMPGKQMAIDADLSAGLIDEDQARIRRKELEAESSFFGAMDGAAKFVRGDAVAGLLITFINVIGGIIIGVGQRDLSFMVAANNYTQLTVGDGLVTQIPALIVSTAAGIIVTKAGLSGATEKALFGQLAGSAKALGMCAGLMILLALLPGIPMLPFVLLAAITGGLAAMSRRRDRAQAQAVAEAAAAPPPAPAEEPISAALHMDDIRLELGYGLLPLVSGAGEGPRLTDQVKALRRQLAAEMGFVMPSVRIQDNMQLPAERYILRVREIEAGRGEVRPALLLAMDPRGEELTLQGEKTREPAFGLPALWIDPGRREEALFRNLTLVEPATVITTHLTELIKDQMATMLSYAETRKLLDGLPSEQQKLVSDLIPAQITVGGVQRVLQNLLAERVSIRDLSTILEGVSEACGSTRNVTLISEHVRTRLARQISDMCTNERGFIPLLTLSPEWEQAFAEAMVGAGDDRQLALAPSKLQQFVTALRAAYERLAKEGESPVLLTSPGIRPHVRAIVERFRPNSVVISQGEVSANARIKTVGRVI